MLKKKYESQEGIANFSKFRQDHIPTKMRSANTYRRDGVRHVLALREVDREAGVRPRGSVGRVDGRGEVRVEMNIPYEAPHGQQSKKDQPHEAVGGGPLNASLPAARHGASVGLPERHGPRQRAAARSLPVPRGPASALPMTSHRRGQGGLGNS